MKRWFDHQCSRDEDFSDEDTGISGSSFSYSITSLWYFPHQQNTSNLSPYLSQASPQGSTVCSCNKQARDPRIDGQDIHHEVRQQLVHKYLPFLLVSVINYYVTNYTDWCKWRRNCSWSYLVGHAYVVVGKWVTVFVNGVHGEARKHSQAHSHPQTDHVDVQRPERWERTCQDMKRLSHRLWLLFALLCEQLTSWRVPKFCKKCSAAPGTGWWSR